MYNGQLWTQGELVMSSCCSDVRRAECHCPVCHTTWASLSLFDAHQAVSYGNKPVVTCLKPTELRLDGHGMPVRARSPQAVEERTLSQNHRGVWHTAEGLQKRRQAASLLASMRPPAGTLSHCGTRKHRAETKCGTP
jgi:hypothetical protein